MPSHTSPSSFPPPISFISVLCLINLSPTIHLILPHLSVNLLLSISPYASLHHTTLPLLITLSFYLSTVPSPSVPLSLSLLFYHISSLSSFPQFPPHVMPLPLPTSIHSNPHPSLPLIQFLPPFLLLSLHSSFPSFLNSQFIHCQLLIIDTPECSRPV